MKALFGMGKRGNIVDLALFKEVFPPKGQISNVFFSQLGGNRKDEEIL